MLAEFFRDVFNRLDSRHTSAMEEQSDPKDGSVAVGYFGADGKWNPVFKSKGTIFEFPAVTVYSAESLIAYANSHADKAMTSGRALLRVNKDGLFLSVDFGAGEKPEERKHLVSFPAAFDEECEAAASAINNALGKWIALDVFDTLLDKCAPFIANFTALEDAAANMEGHETAKVGKTATGYNVQVTGEVSSAVDIPKMMSVRLLFMGHSITAEIPLRLTVENKQVKFCLVDNGALAKARMSVLREIKAEVVAELPFLLVIDGRTT